MDLLTVVSLGLLGQLGLVHVVLSLAHVDEAGLSVGAELEG